MNPLAMVDMRNKLKGNENHKSKETGINAFTLSNLDSIESKLIKELIQGDKKAVEGKTSNMAISFDEAVNKIKNSR